LSILKLEVKQERFENVLTYQKEKDGRRRDRRNKTEKEREDG
jgi:hypothetical protein